jgi:hypothetical protein
MGQATSFLMVGWFMTLHYSDSDPIKATLLGTIGMLLVAIGGYLAGQARAATAGAPRPPLGGDGEA